jgi:ABC-type bacteriocin/lantibiotic exporter with double-glycine peptidase domain
LFLGLLGGSFELAGCYHGSARSVSLGDLHGEPGWLMVHNVPMLHQSSDHDCGAAALAMILARWGVVTASGAELEVLHAVPLDPQHGITAGALRDLARRRGLRAFLIKGEIADLTREIGLDRPVLVGLVQRYGDDALSHYEVVVGMNPRARRLLLFDPARGPREDDYDGFATEWGRADHLALVTTAADGASPR